MSDKKPVFMTLKDAATGDGLALHKVLEGDAAAAKNASAALVAKDDGGNLDYLNVDDAGALIVSTEGAATTCITAVGSEVAGSASLVEVATTSLTASTDYKNVEFIVSCFHPAVYKVEWVDDDGGMAEVVTVLAEAVCGAGQYTVTADLACTKFTTGATGTQTLRVRALNIDELSCFRARINVLELNP